MTKLLTHRGPDDEGYFDSGAMHLGMRRLAVIDLTTGRQPIFNEDKTVAVVFNGEIFNYIELREELKQRGHEFYTQTDTEVIVHAYEEWGTDCLAHFNGMFAFAVWDEQRQRLFMARDRLGEKPLYYARHDGRFLFASEIKSLLKEMPAQPQLDDEFWILETVNAPRTMFRGIESLPPAHALTYEGSTLKVWQYWIIPSDEHNENERGWSAEQVAEKLRALVDDAVRIRLRSDVPLGAFLSGGLDSSYLCCVARPQKVFVCRFPYGAAYDEFRYAELVAKHIGAEVHIIEPTPEDFRVRLPIILWHLDQPIATMSPIGEFMLAERARQHITVTIGGQGGDELFGGYARYFLMLEEARLGRSPNPDDYASHPLVKDYLPLAQFFWTGQKFDDPARRFLDLVRRSEPTGAMQQRVTDLFATQRSLINQMGVADLHLQFPSLITMNDRAASAVGLENRTPFLDHRIVELAFQMPSAFKIRDGVTKWIVHEAARGIVPDEILNRTDKKGLVVPVTHWLKNELKGWADDLIGKLQKRNVWRGTPQSARGEFDRSRYTQVCLELWFEQFVDEAATGRRRQ